MRYETVLSGKFGHARFLLAEIAARQYGLITVTQLRACGLSDSAVSKRVRRGEFHRVHAGVYAVGHDAPAREAQWLAGVLAGGPGSALARLCGAKLWEVSRFPAPMVEVVVPRQRRSQPGIRFYRANELDPRDVTSHEHMPSRRCTASSST